MSLTLLAFWHPLIAWRYRQQISELKSELESAPIKVVSVPLAIIPGRYFLDSSRLFPILYYWTLLLFSLMLRRRYDIVHSRGYLASYASAVLSKRFHYKTVFDMRSLWAKEHVSIGAWKPDDPIYRMWERIEYQAVQQSDVAVVQNGPMAKEVGGLGTGTNVVEIPICVDIDLFEPVSNARDRIRAELDWTDNFVIGYHGSLGLENRNIIEIANYFSMINRAVPNSRLLILTSNKNVDIPAVMAAAGVEAGTFATKHPIQNEIPTWFSAVDTGMHAMSEGPDSHTRLSVKVVEYLSCGLPVTLNPYVGAAAEIVSKERLGVVLTGSEDSSVIERELTQIGANRAAIGARSRRTAVRFFSVRACAEKYLAVYESLLEADTESL